MSTTEEFVRAITRAPSLAPGGETDEQRRERRIMEYLESVSPTKSREDGTKEFARGIMETSRERYGWWL